MQNWLVVCQLKQNNRQLRKGYLKIAMIYQLVYEFPEEYFPIINSLTFMNTINSNIFKVKKPTANEYRDGVRDLNPTNTTSNDQALRQELQKREQFYENQSYSFYSELFLNRLTYRAQNNHSYLRKYNLKGIVSGMTRKLLMNELQLLFLSYLTTDDNWNIHHPIIQKMADRVKQQPNQSEEIEDINEYRQLVLYLYLVGYATKYYLNGQDEAELFNHAVAASVAHFTGVFEEWANDQGATLLVIKPQKLNNAFKQLVSKDTERAELMDYNRMVEQLLIISPSYKIMDMDQGRAKLQEMLKKTKPIDEIEQVIMPKPMEAESAPAKKKIKLGFSTKQQDVNSHINPLLQTINLNQTEKQRERPISVKQSSSRSKEQQSGLFAIPEDYSQLSAFRFRPYNRKSQMTSRLNLQRSSIYDFM